MTNGNSHRSFWLAQVPKSDATSTLLAKRVGKSATAFFSRAMSSWRRYMIVHVFKDGFLGILHSSFSAQEDHNVTLREFMNTRTNMQDSNKGGRN
jgi:hypothetical protein